MTPSVKSPARSAGRPLDSSPSDDVELMSGIDALVRIAVEQRRIDQAAGLRTATLFSGYPGSPLGGVDLTLERMRPFLQELEISHVPAVNEELAASAVWGTQMQTALGASQWDGIVGIWYGKGPGVDRSGDVFKHGNSMGVSPRGGVLVCTGDDPSAKSSTLPTDSRTNLFDANFPTLLPASVPELIAFGLHGIALSRYCGLWVGLKVPTDLADGLASLRVADLLPVPVLPSIEVDGKPWTFVQAHTLNNVASLQQEEDIVRGRVEAAQAYSLANQLNRVTHATADDRIGFVAVGKAHADLLQALRDLGLDDEAIARAGIRILKIGMSHPLEQTTLRSFARGLEEIVVVEEKRPLVETLLRDALYAQAQRPLVLGKRDEEGRDLLPGWGELTPERMLRPLVSRLRRRVPDLRLPEEPRLAGPRLLPTVGSAVPRRVPAFCSGCPHSRSTAGSPGVVGGGAGCNAIIYIEDRHSGDTILPLTPMGSEGVPWIGASRYSEHAHVFQNLGDGTLTHSGSLAVRATVAAGVNITYKILYNAVVAMTGGQPLAGASPVPNLTREFEAMGVKRIIVCADDPRKYGRKVRWAPGVEVWSRDRVRKAEQVLAATPGTTVLIYDQRCAAESRRLWKSHELEEPRRRVVINESACEGCGDCQVKSNCLSVVPIETELGRKTQILQSSCNHDLTCLDGDCPSFVTVDVLSERPSVRQWPAPPDDLPEPECAAGDRYSTYMVGIGGTGVVTVNRLLAAAAISEGWTVAGLDQTGLSQKGGAVASHLRLERDAAPATNAVGRGAADLYLAFDVLAGADDRHLLRTSAERTAAVVSMSLAPTASMLTHALQALPRADLFAQRIEANTRRHVACDPQTLCEAVFGDQLPANVLQLGVACQAGLLPVSAAALEDAIAGMGAAGMTNVAAFRWGRAAVARPEAVAEVIAEAQRSGAKTRTCSRRAETAAVKLLASTPLAGRTRELAEWRLRDLVDYQDERLAARYLRVLSEAWEAERRVGDATALSELVAFHLYKLMAYKDEYEVARLHLDPSFRTSLAERFPGGRVRFQLHPPALRSLGLRRKIGFAPWLIVPLFHALRPLRRLRGTSLDPFGHAKVRRVERRLVAEYEARILRVLRALSRDTYDTAVEIASLPDRIRGYEEVKLANVREYDERAAELEQVILSRDGKGAAA